MILLFTYMCTDAVYTADGRGLQYSMGCVCPRSIRRSVAGALRATDADRTAHTWSTRLRQRDVDGHLSGRLPQDICRPYRILQPGRHNACRLEHWAAKWTKITLAALTYCCMPARQCSSLPVSSASAADIRLPSHGKKSQHLCKFSATHFTCFF
jgi:hypothetical protein